MPARLSNPLPINTRLEGSGTTEVPLFGNVSEFVPGPLAPFRLLYPSTLSSKAVEGPLFWSQKTGPEIDGLMGEGATAFSSVNQ